MTKENAIIKKDTCRGDISSVFVYILKKKKMKKKRKKITLSEEINVEFATKKKMYFLTPTARCMFIATSYLERKPKYYIII